MFHSFFKNTRKQPADEIRLFSDRDLAEQGGEGFTASDVAADSDLSYDDAVLDLEMRTFFHHEYGLAEPQANVYGRVLHSINAGQLHAHTAAPAPVPAPSWPARVSLSFARAMTGSMSARLVPGAVALMLVIGVLGSNTARFLSGQADVIRSGAYATPAASATPSNFIVIKDGQADAAAPEALSVPRDEALTDMVALDPYEMGLPPRARTARTHTDNKDSTDYVTVAGPQ